MLDPGQLQVATGSRSAPASGWKCRSSRCLGLLSAADWLLAYAAAAAVNTAGSWSLSDTVCVLHLVVDVAALVGLSFNPPITDLVHGTGAVRVQGCECQA